MKNIIFIAPPAAGKGTQSDLLVKKYGYSHISTGDLLRKEVSSCSKLGQELDEIMKSGKLVSDEIVNTLLENCLKQDETKKGFILDGYPRNIEQAHSLNDLLIKLDLNDYVVLYLDMDEETAMHRALGRVTCPQCKRGYNKYENALKPKVENLCDDCKIELISRSDDNEETFKTRYETYVKNTESLLSYYKEIGVLKMIDNNGTPDDTFKKIEGVI